MRYCPPVFKSIDQTNEVFCSSQTRWIPQRNSKSRKLNDWYEPLWDHLLKMLIKLPWRMLMSVYQLVLNDKEKRWICQKYRQQENVIIYILPCTLTLYFSNYVDTLLFWNDSLLYHLFLLFQCCTHWFRCTQCILPYKYKQRYFLRNTSSFPLSSMLHWRGYSFIKSNNSIIFWMAKDNSKELTVGNYFILSRSNIELVWRQFCRHTELLDYMWEPATVYKKCDDERND